MKILLTISLVIAISLSGYMLYGQTTKWKEIAYYKGIQERIDDAVKFVDRQFLTADRKLSERILQGRYERKMAPNYSFCHRCGRPWKYAKGHTTMITENRGSFPLCEKCWSELTPEERLPFYRRLINERIHDAKLTNNYTDYTDDTDYEKQWELMKKAVLKGK